jgi:predicted dehydrogenase
MHFDHSAAPKIDSHALVVLGFEDGSTGVVDTSSAVAFPKPTFQIAGTEATFQKFGVDPQEAFMKLEKIEQSKDDEKSYGRLRKLTHSGVRRF